MKFLSVLLIALGYLAGYEAFKCYECSGATACAESMDTMATSECTSQCRAGYQITSVMGVNMVAVTQRGCYSSCYESSVTIFGVKSINNCCIGEKCNGVINAAPASMTSCVSCSGSSLSTGDDCGVLSTDDSTVSCPGQCFIKAEESGSYITYRRGCSPICTESTDSDGAYKCCDGEKCNEDASGLLPTGFNSCWRCSGDGENSCLKWDYVAPEESQTSVSVCKGKCSKSRTEVPFVNTELWTRDCQSSCNPGSFNIFGIESETWCCEGDFCNGAINLKMGVFGIALNILIVTLVRIA